MSKKKRNRRPSPGSRPASAPTAVIDTVEADTGMAADQVDDEIAAAGEAMLQALAGAVGSEDAEDAQDGQRMTADEEPVAPVAPAAPTDVASAGWIPHESGDIRGVLIQIAGGRLLLPNATIAEVLSYAEPETDADAAAWLLGRFRWRGWQLPLLAFSRLAGIGEEKPGLGSKVVVLKALGGDQRIPYFALLTHGFPRLVTVSPAALELEATGEPLPRCVQARVRLNDEPALLPDLLQIEQVLREDREAA